MTVNGSCTLFGGDAYKCNVILILKSITASLSVIGCVFMIFIIWIFRKYNASNQKLILWLTIAALFDSIGYLMANVTPDGSLCDFKAWWMTYFDWTVLMWTTCITISLYRFLKYRRKTPHLYFHLVSWGIPPLLFSLLPLIKDQYGPAGAWCWIKHDSNLWRFFIWYIPLLLIMIVIFGLWAITFWQHKNAQSEWHGGANATNNDVDHNIMEEDIKTVMWYPLVYLVLSLFPFILRIHNAFTEEGTDVFALWVLTVLTAPLQGACNAIVFGMDPDTKTKLSLFQIKMAWQTRFAREPIIREYPTSPETPGSTLATQHSEISDGKDSREVPYGSFGLEEITIN